MYIGPMGQPLPNNNLDTPSVFAESPALLSPHSNNDLFCGNLKPKSSFFKRVFKRTKPDGTSSWSILAVLGSITVALGSIFTIGIGIKAGRENLTFGKAFGQFVEKLKFWDKSSPCNSQIIYLGC